MFNLFKSRRQRIVENRRARLAERLVIASQSFADPIMVARVDDMKALIEAGEIVLVDADNNPVQIDVIEVVVNGIPELQVSVKPPC